MILGRRFVAAVGRGFHTPAPCGLPPWDIWGERMGEGGKGPLAVGVWLEALSGVSRM
jgi:hypothetical protein